MRTLKKALSFLCFLVAIAPWVWCLLLTPMAYLFLDLDLLPKNIAQGDAFGMLWVCLFSFAAWTWFWGAASCIVDA